MTNKLPGTTRLMRRMMSRNYVWIQQKLMNKQTRRKAYCVIVIRRDVATGY